jgi:hypothetical protein
MNQISTTPRETPGNSRHSSPSSACYPFGFSREDYTAELEFRETRDLMREVESAQWLALQHADEDNGTRTYIEHQLPAMLEELERRKRLLLARHDDPLCPLWPKRDDTLKERVRAVKAAWPIERFCRELLACDLAPSGTRRWKTRCPLPGHNDTTPSFFIYENTDSAWCFGCQRGGDVLKLTQYVLNEEHFIDALKALERGVMPHGNR